MTRCRSECYLPAQPGASSPLSLGCYLGWGLGGQGPADGCVGPPPGGQAAPAGGQRGPEGGVKLCLLGDVLLHRCHPRSVWLVLGSACLGMAVLTSCEVCHTDMGKGAATPWSCGGVERRLGLGTPPVFWAPHGGKVCCTHGWWGFLRSTDPACAAGGDSLGALADCPGRPPVSEVC